MGTATDRYAAAAGISRQVQDEVTLRSHLGAVAARSGGHFAEEIVPVSAPQGRRPPVVVSDDKGIRPESSISSL